MPADLDSGRLDITFRLFQLVSRLDRDQQFQLLKQLTGERVTLHLFKQIVEMAESEQLLLLERLGQLAEGEAEERTLHLMGSEPRMREYPRKSCLINADYRVRGRECRSYILDISIGGVFIETRDRYAVGEEVILNFNLPDHPQPFSLRGRIAWSGPEGFGVKFDHLPPSQGSAIRRYVEQPR